MNVREMLLVQGLGGRLEMDRRIWGLLTVFLRVQEGQLSQASLLGAL